MTEGALDGLSGSVLSDGTFSDDGRAFLAIERRMNIVKAVNFWTQYISYCCLSAVGYDGPIFPGVERSAAIYLRKTLILVMAAYEKGFCRKVAPTREPI